MNKNNLNLSIIIPAYNEEKALADVLSSLSNTMDNFGVVYEIIAVNDCSTDKSAEILKKFPAVKTVTHTCNKGYGASLKTGIKNSQYDWVAIIDGDGTYPIDALPAMMEETERYEMIIGARDKNSEGIHISRKHSKMFLNRFAGYLANKKIPDLNSGMRIFKKEIALNYWELFPNRFSFSTTLTMVSLSHGYETIFFPISYHKRKGRSSIKPTDFFSFLKLVVKLSLFFRPLKVFGPLSLAIFSVAIIVLASFLIGITSKFLDTTFVTLVALAIQTFFFGLLAEIVIHNRKH